MKGFVSQRQWSDYTVKTQQENHIFLQLAVFHWPSYKYKDHRVKNKTMITQQNWGKGYRLSSQLTHHRLDPMQAQDMQGF
jgi:hypothetical protein